MDLFKFPSCGMTQPCASPAQVVRRQIINTREFRVFTNDPPDRFLTEAVTPTVVFSYLPTNPTAGSTVTFTATVTGVVNGPTPTGNVRFLYGYTFLKAGTLNNGVVTVKVKVPYPKTHPFRALYIGDNYNSTIQIEQK